MRRFRPSAGGAVQKEKGCPVFLNSTPATGKILQCAGPYRLSGNWWDQERWQTEEWDIELAEGGLYRLSQARGAWTVEGCYDVC